jgi:hypothetical protein
MRRTALIGVNVGSQCRDIEVDSPQRETHREPLSQALAIDIVPPLRCPPRMGNMVSPVYSVLVYVRATRLFYE